jgi:hypothetical protein
MGRETTSLFDQRVYAQATPPQDTRDGIIWVDTSLADKPTKVYSADTQSFVAVGVADYSQLENRIIGTEVDEYIDGTAGQVESKGFQTPTNYESSVVGGRVGDSGTLTDGLEDYVGYFIDSYEYEIYFSLNNNNNDYVVNTDLSFTPSGGLTGVNELNIPTDPEDTINYSEQNTSKTFLLSDSANFDPIQVTESDPFSFSYDLLVDTYNTSSYTVEYAATFNVVTNIPHKHEFDYAN